MNPVATAINRMLHKVLRPLASLLLRNGFAYGDFMEVARRVFVEAAAQELAIPGRKQSVSRISLLTGVNRKEVKRLLESTAEDDPTGDSNRAARVISAWLRDERFHDVDGQPAVLSWGQADEIGFEALVRLHSGDIPARAILDELLRVGAVTQLENGDIRLDKHGYIPAGSDAELIRLAINYNLSLAREKQSANTRLQLSVSYNDLPAQSVEVFKTLSTEKGRELLLQLDQFLATQDRSTNPSVSGEGRHRAGMGIYFFEQEIGEPDRADKNEDDNK